MPRRKEKGMKKRYFKGSPNEVLGSRCLLYLPHQQCDVWGYILGFKNNYYLARVEETGEYVRTRYVVN